MSDIDPTAGLNLFSYLAILAYIFMLKFWLPTTFVGVMAAVLIFNVPRASKFRKVLIIFTSCVCLGIVNLLAFKLQL